MQAVRTAGQKQLSLHLSAMATTLVRFLFAVPFVWIYLWVVSFSQSSPLPVLSQSFITSASLASLAQIIGSGLMIMAFRYKNFAVATSLAKTEAVLTAVVGFIAFDAALSGFGWISVVVGVLGVLILSKVDVGILSIFKSRASLYGVGAGFFFALATLWIREASLSLHSDLILSAAFTLAFMVTLQTLLVGAYLYWKDSSQFVAIGRNWRIGLFVGITSMIGSIGWFTAASFQDAAYVKALGQIEFFFTLFITQRFFKEKITPKEYIGMSLIIVSVLVLLLLT